MKKRKISSLHNFLADIWNNSVQTCGNNRFNHKYSCWLEVGNMTYKKLPEYMKKEYDRGRILIYPHFPDYCYDDMEYEYEV